MTPSRVDADSDSGAATSELRASGFAVVDLETTGLGPTQERILELGIVCLGPSGEVMAEWTSRFNPGGRMGATHVHGITAEDVAEAPRFRDRVGEIVGLLRGRVLVAHNAVFDVAFLRAEFDRAGWALPEAPAFCTLQASWYYLPDLHGRRLPQCSWRQVSAGAPGTLRWMMRERPRRYFAGTWIRLSHHRRLPNTSHFHSSQWESRGRPGHPPRNRVKRPARWFVGIGHHGAGSASSVLGPVIGQLGEQGHASMGVCARERAKRRRALRVSRYRGSDRVLSTPWALCSAGFPIGRVSEVGHGMEGR